MRPLAEMPFETAARIRAVFADIDDTLTSEGCLPAAAYGSLETLRDAGFAVAAVTGRPAGWCDMIARLWPVNGVVGENGAMYFAYDAESRKMMRVYAADAREREISRARLKSIEKRILQEVPGCAVSADQPYREADLAIDIREDVAPLDHFAISRIKTIFEESGATAKVSSIHVNGWFGAYDKLSMTRRFAREALGMDIDAMRDQVVFCGDSPNDEPMFAHFPNSCGVANVRDFTGQLRSRPAWVSGKRGGEGFAEIAAWLIAARNPRNLRMTA